MLNSIITLNRKLKRFSNKIERLFLSEQLNDDVKEKINFLNNYFKEEDLIKENKKINISNFNNQSNLEKELDKKGILYYLSIITNSPFEFSNFLNQLELEIKKIIFNNNQIIYEDSIIKIVNDNEIQSLGKYLDDKIIINEELIIKNNLNKIEIIIHEVIHMILFKTGLLKNLNELFENNNKIDELLCEFISKNYENILRIPKFESPEKRIKDFKIIKNFIETKTNIKEISCLELGSGEGIFLSICKSFNFYSKGIDYDEDLNSIKTNFVKFKDIKNLKINKNYSFIHSNAFMYLNKKEINNFFKLNINNFNFIYICYNSEIINNSKDINRISFLKEEYFLEICELYNLKYIEIEKNKIRILCKKEVLINGS